MFFALSSRVLFKLIFKFFLGKICFKLLVALGEVLQVVLSFELMGVFFLKGFSFLVMRFICNLFCAFN
jgi:hypothetical protein